MDLVFFTVLGNPESPYEFAQHSILQEHVYCMRIALPVVSMFHKYCRIFVFIWIGLNRKLRQLNALQHSFTRAIPLHNAVTTLSDFSTHDSLLIRLPPLSIPLSFPTAPPPTCSATVERPGSHRSFFRVTIRPKERRHVDGLSALRLPRNIVYGSGIS